MVTRFIPCSPGRAGELLRAWREKVGKDKDWSRKLGRRQALGKIPGGNPA